MSNKIAISICMGSSCYSRGNKRVKEVVEEYISANKLEDRIDFRGDLCCGMCGEGPNISVDGVVYHYVDEEVILDILESKFSKRESHRKKV